MLSSSRLQCVRKLALPSTERASRKLQPVVATRIYPCRDYSSTELSSSGLPNDKPDVTTSTTSTVQQARLANTLFKNPIVHQLWTERQKAKERQKQKEEEAAAAAAKKGKQDTETARTTKSSSTTSSYYDGKTPSQSRVEISYPFTSDVLLVEAYRSPWGRVRLGKILEDIDALAGNIAYYHCENVEQDDDEQPDEPRQHPLIVTASVDRIRLDSAQPGLGSDQHLSGQVTWTGTSSMEIRMQCMDADSKDVWLEAFVTYVTLDPQTKKPMRIPPILPETAQEEQFFQEGAARAALKKKMRQRQKQPALLQQQQSQAESFPSALLNEMAESYLAEAGPLLNMPSLADPHSILMSQTKMQNALIAQPQFQNLHNRIFGGFLMRRAFELAFANAYVFGGSRPISKDVDEVTFASPVSVGDLLIFNSRVVYTEGIDTTEATTTAQQDEPDKNNKNAMPLIHVEVEAWVSEPENVMARLSNQFYFTFAVDVNANAAAGTASSKNNNSRIRRVLPSNIDEARRMAFRVLVDQGTDRNSEIIAHKFDEDRSERKTGP
jgi:acyl-coenzyme A thioesterase 9